MDNLIKLGRLNYALGMAGLGSQHFYFPGFRPVFVPSWSQGMPDPQVLVYLSGFCLIISSLFIIFNFKARETSLLLGSVLLLLFILVHVPFLISNNTTSLGGWTDAFKILALSGGSFVIARSVPISKNDLDAKLFKPLEKLIPLGSIFFAIMLIIFGIDHFLYYQFVQTLVPVWIPFPLFWTYFAAIALIGSGISFIFRIKIKLVGILTAIMLFLWLIILHIPRAIAMPEAANGNELTSVFEALAFSGVALVIAFTSSPLGRANFFKKKSIRVSQP
jgi:uncharacterized membrane protein YphA (DoxX/SURF4 family)